MNGVQPEWIAGHNFVMLHLDLVDALDGSLEAALLLDRIRFRSGGDGWWAATYAEMMADCRLSEHKFKTALTLLRDRGFIEDERVTRFESRRRYRVVVAGEDVPPGKDATSRPGDMPHPAPEKDATTFSSSLKEQEELTGSEHVDAVDGLFPEPTRLRTVDPPQCVDAWFAEWYDAYPKHVGRAAARKAYARAVAHGADPTVMLAGLKAQRSVFADRESRFIPHPATWLNQGRWDDDIPVAAPSFQGCVPDWMA